jgi:replicative DNA helicase
MTYIEEDLQATEMISLATSPEALLLSAVLQTGEYQVLAKHGVTGDLFHVFPDEAEWLFQYIANNSKAPTKAAMRNAFPDFVIYKVDDTEHWVKEVFTAHKRQSLVDLMDLVADLVDAGSEDKALESLQKGVSHINASSVGIRSGFNVYDEMDAIYENVKARVERVRLHGQAGIPTGFKTLDKITGGLQPGWFGVIAGRLGEGKTWTGIKMGFEAAHAGHTVSYFSLEQSRMQIAMRFHAFASRAYAKEVFNPMDLMRGKGFDLREYKDFMQTMSEQARGKFNVNDTSRGLVTPTTVAQVIEREQPQLVIIDYLTLLGTTSDDWRGTAKVSSELQGIGQNYDVPVVALSQVNRLAIGKEPPDASHLSQADAIGQDADFVVTHKRHGKSVQRMFLPKFRHGVSGDKWWAKFSPGTGEYEEIDPQEASDIIADEDEDE